MTLDSDILIDRRRLKRRLVVWRVIAIIAIVAVVAALVGKDDEAGSAFGIGRPQIARVAVNGFIGDSRERHELLTKLRKDDSVKAVIVTVDSPGGSTSGGEALYLDLRELAAEKPVAAVFGTAATSAAYLGGIATDYIVARGNTITGSVGVIFQWPDFSELLGKIGVKVEELRSGPLKAKPSPFTPTDDDARRVAQELVQEAQGWFVGLVVERRKPADAVLDDIKTGRIYTGRQALKIGLVDAIGDESTAIKWFTDTRKVEAGLKVVDRKPESPRSSRFLPGALANAAHELGISAETADTILSQWETLRVRSLDGLLSIWHAE